MKKKYILLKDTPELKKGAVVEARCEGGGQEYECENEKFFQKKDQSCCLYTEKVVEESPEWFQEICFVEVPKEQVVKVKKFIKSLK